MNGWFPKLRADGVIASGNAGIWRTPLVGTAAQLSPVGTGPVWASSALVYNRNDNTTQVGNGGADGGWGAVLPIAFNDYVGSDIGQWAGFLSVGTGEIHRYKGPTLMDAISGACAPRFYGGAFGYLQPFQPGPGNQRQLIVDGILRASGVIIDWTADRGGRFFVYTRATGTYTKAIIDSKGNDCTIRRQADESPLVAFFGPGDLPWIVSVTPESGTFVRMIYSAGGYVIQGDLYYPDARMMGDRLHVVGSLGNGTPREIWIDFTAPTVDLREV